MLAATWHVHGIVAAVAYRACAGNDACPEEMSVQEDGGYQGIWLELRLTPLVSSFCDLQVEGATDAAIGISDRDGATAILGAAGKILADAHKHMFAEVFGGPKL